MDNPILFAELRNCLAELYPDEASAWRVVADAGLAAQRIVLNNSAQNNWHAILSETAKRDQLAALFAIVNREYPNQPVV